MTALAYYNENDPKAARWLRELVKEGLIAPGDVDDRSIVEVRPADVAGYRQCHFFAGIGGWSYALRLAGWPDDRPVWSGSVPCTPFSTAGLKRGFDDPRHLWPQFHRLIVECRPPVVFGEQVASGDGLRWLDLVLSDMEDADYACGAFDLCAAGVGAPHIRQRLYWCAEPMRPGCPPLRGEWTGWRSPTASDGEGGVDVYRPGMNYQYKLRDYAPLAGWYSPKAGDVKEGAEQPNRWASPWGCGGVAVQSQMAGWRSPTANDSRTSGRYANGELKVGGQAELCGWPTPNTGEGGAKTYGRRGDNWNLMGAVDLAGWRTPISHDGEGVETPERVVERRGGMQRLMVQAQLAGWRSPRAIDGDFSKPTEIKGGVRDRGRYVLADFAGQAAWSVKKKKEEDGGEEA